MTTTSASALSQSREPERRRRTHPGGARTCPFARPVGCGRTPTSLAVEPRSSASALSESPNLERPLPRSARSLRRHPVVASTAAGSGDCFSTPEAIAPPSWRLPRPGAAPPGVVLMSDGGSVGAGPRPRTVALMSRGAARPLTRGTTFRAEQARRTPATAAGSPRGATSRPAQRPHRDASACGPPRRCSSPPRSPRPMVVVPNSCVEDNG